MNQIVSGFLYLNPRNKNNIKNVEVKKPQPKICNTFKVESNKIIPKNFGLSTQKNYLEEYFKQIKETIIAIQNSKPISQPSEHLFEAVDDIRNEKISANLYDEIKQICEDFVKSNLKQFLQEDCDQVNFLKKVNSFWQFHCQQMLYIRCMALFLDRIYALHNIHVLSIWDLGLEIFKKEIFLQGNMKTKIIEGLLEQIKKERNGEIIDRDLLKSLIRMLTSIKLYSETFEGKFLRASKDFFAAEGRRLVEELDTKSYLYHIDRRLQEEKQRLWQILENNTQNYLIPILDRQLITKHLKTILIKGNDVLLDANIIKDISLMYTLLNRTKDGLNELCKFFNAYIKKKGTLLVSHPSKDKTMVLDLLDFKEKIDIIISCSFQKNEKFQNSSEEAFEVFINSRPDKPAQMIAKYVDAKLRTSSKKLSEEELEKDLDKIMVLFKFIHSKDVFEAFYKKDLAKRLLVDKSASFDAEKSMLSKLKQECGAGFTNKLEGMFKDMELSKELMVNFKAIIKSSEKLNSIEMTVNVLTMGYWPTYQPSRAIVPSYLIEYREKFKVFYSTKFSSRNLQWQPNLDLVLLKACFGSAIKEVHLSMYQALILLLFTYEDEHDYEYIKNETGLEEKELNRTLQSLACGKLRVLIKVPKSKDINQDDSFVFNHSFKNELFRIKINQVLIKETQEEQDKTHKKVFQDRQFEIDACIVRIMKTRKSLLHNNLISELYQQLKFPVKPADFKKRIENLIERDYMQRDENDPKMYHYVA